MADATLHHFNGSGTTITDAVSGNAWVANGSATQTTTSPILGAASLSLDAAGTSSVSSTTASLLTALGVGTGKWRIDMRLKSVGATAPPTFFTGLFVTSHWGLRFRNFGTEVEFEGGNVAVGGTLINGSSHLLTVTFDDVSTKLYVFVDGTLSGSVSYSSNLATPTVVHIGAETDLTRGWHSYMDEVRFTPGVTQTTSFVDPGTEFPDPGGPSTGIGQLSLIGVGK